LIFVFFPLQARRCIHDEMIIQAPVFPFQKSAMIIPTDRLTGNIRKSLLKRNDFTDPTVNWHLQRLAMTPVDHPGVETPELPLCHVRCAGID